MLYWTKAGQGSGRYTNTSVRNVTMLLQMLDKYEISRIAK